MFNIGERITHEVTHRAGRQLLRASPRVLGVGAGVFVLGFFLVVCVCVCALGSRSTRPRLVCAASAAVYATVALVLLASPKGEPPPPSPVGHDRTAAPLGAVLALCSLGVLGGCGGMLVLHVRVPRYARPLSYHADVLNQR